jgi:integrase
MALTDTALRAAKPREKPYKVYDEKGLYLLVTPAGGRSWRFKYRLQGREKLLAIGLYPDVPLSKARHRRDEARRQVADGIDPSARKRSDRTAQINTFETIALEWLELQTKKLSPHTYAKKLGWFEALLFPYLGKRPIASITAQDLLAVLKRIEAKGFHETAHRARSAAGNVFRFAVATGRADRDWSVDLRGALAPVITKNRAAITEPARIGELLRRIHAHIDCQPTTAAALKLAPLLFVRPGELRGAEWREFDLDSTDPEWRIPGRRMKMGQEHIVPLPSQAVTILEELQLITGGGTYVFPSLRGGHRPISENTVNVALRTLGYSGEEMCGHGFRAMASTCLNEQGFPPDVIELQLAHAERNEVRAAYNRASRIPERRKMMQAWADYLDGLRHSGTVIPIHRAAR